MKWFLFCFSFILRFCFQISIVYYNRLYLQDAICLTFLFTFTNLTIPTLKPTQVRSNFALFPAKSKWVSTRENSAQFQLVFILAFYCLEYKFTASRRVSRSFSGQGRFLKRRTLRQTFNLQHTKETPRREKFWKFFSQIRLKRHFK